MPNGFDFDLMGPAEGPPLPRSMGIYWPWYKPITEGIPTAIPTVPTYYPPVYEAPGYELPYAPVVSPVTTIEITQPPVVIPEAPVTAPSPGEAPTVPDLRFGDLMVSPSTVTVGEPVKVSVLGRNIGDAIGSERITCELNGVVQDKSISLSPGESRSIVFSFIPKEPGDFSVLVAGLVGHLKVIERPVAPVVTPPTPPVAPPTPLVTPPEPTVPTFTVDLTDRPDEGGYCYLDPYKESYQFGEGTSVVAVANGDLDYILDYWTVDGRRAPEPPGKYRLPLSVVKNTKVVTYWKKAPVIVIPPEEERPEWRM